MKFIKVEMVNIIFVLKAGYGKKIATSEMYTTKDGCKNGIQSVNDNASTAQIKDLT